MMSETTNILQPKAFQPTHSNPSWDRLSLIMPSVYANTMSFYEALQGVIDSVNDTRQDMNDLVDWTNERDDELVKYLNKQIEDFTNANNEFYQKVDNLVQKFITDETAAREQFEQDITNLVNEYKQYLDEKYAQFTAEITEKFNTLKNQFDALKTAVDTFMHDMTAAFEAFKQEIRDLINQYHDENEQFKSDLEAWKTATFNYFMGQYDTIKAALEARLPDIVAEKLPTILADYAGICLYYDPETRKLNVGYADGLARNGDNKLIATGGGGTGGDTISAGNGIEITDIEGTKRIAVKIGQNLSFSDDGTLNATGGDTISAGNGIAITDENGVKRVAVKIGQNLSFSEDGTLNATGGAEVPIATADTVGLVKTGDKTKTGLTIAADGTISINQWTPIDVTKDFEFFDSNMTNVAPLWTLDMHYQPHNSSEDKTLYVRMSQNAIDTLGIPTNASIINWTPDEAWTYDNAPTIQSISTSGLLSNSTFKVTVSGSKSGQFLRNGTGTIQFSWQGKENVSTLQFKVIKSEMKLDTVHPISIAGTPIAENDTFKFTVNNWQKYLSISFNMTDGTSISDTSDIRTNGLYQNEYNPQITNQCIYSSYGGTPTIQSNNIANGQVTINVKPDAFGINTTNTLVPIITFNVEYDAQEIFNTWSIKLSSDTLVNFGTTGIIQIDNGRYNGQNLIGTVDDEHILGIGRYNGKSVAMNSGSYSLYPNRNGTATITVTTPYVSTLNMTKTVTVTNNEELKPHIKVTTDSTQVGDTSRDIANPATVDVGNLAKFSKAQGIITFWTSPLPQSSYFDDRDSAQLKIGSTVNRYFNGRVNVTMSYDFSTFNVGDKLSIKYEGNQWRGAYEVIFGEVVE